MSLFGGGHHGHSHSPSSQHGGGHAYQSLPADDNDTAPAPEQLHPQAQGGAGHGRPQRHLDANGQPAAHGAEPDVDVVSAAQRGFLQRVRHFVEVEGYDVNKPDHEDVTLLHWASINNRIAVVKYLLSRGALADALGGHLQSTSLHWAVRQGHLEMSVLLIQHGADPAKTDQQGFNALHLAAQFGHTLICAYLIAKGMDVNALDPDGRTALMWAAYRVFTSDTVRLLISLKADMNVQDNTRNTALHWAVFNGNRVTMKELVTSGARTDIHNEENKTPVDIAVDKNNKFAQNFLEQASGSSHPPWLRKLVQNKILKDRIMWVTPAVFLVWSAVVLAKCTWGYAMLWIIFAWLTCAYLLKTFWLSHGHNPFTLAVFVDSFVLLALLDLFVIWPVNVDRILVSFALWASIVACGYHFWRAWKANPPLLRPSPAEQKRMVVELAEKGTLDSGRFCATCLIPKPLRSKHCGVCGQCVAKFDHHCPFVGNCIGANNHRSFVYYLFFLSLAGALLYNHFMYYLRTVCSQHDGYWEQTMAYFREQTMVAWGLVYAMFQVSWVMVLYLSQSYQVAVNLTTNERMLWRRMDYLKDEDGNYHNPFDQGVRGNFMEFYDGFGILAYTGPRYDWTCIYEVPKDGFEMA